MKRELLRKSVYRRWLDSGTLYGSTHHSLILVTEKNKDNKDNVIFGFLTLYVQLAILTLAQRATILALSAKATTVANGLYKENEPLSLKQIQDIEELQAKYVKAQNQLFLTEATVQEQGVELYQLIKENLYIDANKADLDGHMNNLRDVANISNDRLERRADDNLNRNLSWLTLIGLGIAILQVIPVFDPNSTLCGKVIGVGIAVMIVIIGIILLSSTLFNKENK